MRRIMIVVCAALFVGLLGACGGDDDGDKANGKAAGKAAVYFGWLLGTSEPAAVAIEVDRADAKGMSKVRAYVCDGRGEPEGMAIWFAGPVDAAATTKPGANATLTSAGGKEDLVLEYVSDRRIQGSFKDERGKRRQFAAYPAIDGAGIYEVSLDEDLRYKGTLDRRQQARRDGRRERPDGRHDHDGRRREGRVRRPEPVARHAGAAEARGLPTDYRQVHEGQPGSG